MSADEQNSAIAIFLGKRPSCGNEPEKHEWGDWLTQAKPIPFFYRKCSRCPAMHIRGERFVSIGSGDEVPDYTSSLDAMHDAERALLPLSTMGDSNSPFARYVDNLQKLCGECRWADDPREVTVWEAFAFAINSTAAQRAQAFLQTIESWPINPPTK